LEKDKTSLDPDLLVALSSDEKWVKDPFCIRSRAIQRQLKEGLLIDAHVLFEGVRGGNEAGAVIKAIGQWVAPNDPLFDTALNRANEIRNAILENEIVAYEIDADADDENNDVIEIFARLNQQGITLRPSELATARLTGVLADFRNKARAAMGHKDFVGFVGSEGQEDKIRTGGFVDTDLLIRSAMFEATGSIRYRDLQKRKGEGKKGFQDVANSWDKGCAALRAAVAMFRAAGIIEGGWLPYRYLLLSPAIAHAKGHSLIDQKWLGWAIAASLWGLYAGEAETKAQADAKDAGQGNIGELLKNLMTHAKRSDSVIPNEDDVTQNVVREGGMLLALLVHFVRENTRSFPSQRLLSSHAQAIEIHHIFPRAVLNAYPDEKNDYIPDRLGNLTLIYADDNKQISDTEPSDYLAAVDPAIMKSHCIPAEPALWALDKYVDFCEEREKAIGKIIMTLLKDLGLS
jgi:hypothetical protein